jgi:hypothetical protein
MLKNSGKSFQFLSQRRYFLRHNQAQMPAVDQGFVQLRYITEAWQSRLPFQYISEL